MTNDNTTRKKANAVFFAAVMVISMVAVGFAAAPAAAQSFSDPGEPADIAVGQDSVTQNLAGSTAIDVTTSGATAKANITIDISAHFDAGVVDGDTSLGTVSASTGSVDASQLDTDAQEIEIEATAATSSIVIDTINVDNLNTTNAAPATGIELPIDVNEDGAGTDSGTMAAFDITSGANVVVDSTFASSGETVSQVSLSTLTADSNIANADQRVLVEDDDGNVLYEETLDSASTGTVSLDEDVTEDTDLTATIQGTGDNSDIVYASDTGVIRFSDTSFAENEWGSQSLWEGQVVELDVSSADQSEGAIDVREVTNRDDTGDPVNTRVARSFSINDNTIAVDTSRLRGEGDYVLRDGNGDFLQDDGTWGNLNSGSAAEAEVVTQDLTAEFAEDEANNNEKIDVEVSSLRSSFALEVSGELDGDELDEEELENIFDDEDASGLNDGDDDTVRIDTVEDGDSFVANFTDVDGGDYTFDFAVPDSTAEDSGSINVTELGDGELNLENSVVEEQQGDYANVTVLFEGDSTTGELVIGDESDVGYQANVSIDSGGEDEVSVLFNTYAAGSDGNGTVVQLANPDDTDAELGSFDQTAGGDQNIISDILATGDYTLAVSTANDDPAETLDNPDTLGTLVINERETTNQQIWTASQSTVSDLTDAASDDEEDVTEVLASEIEGNNVTQTDTVAEGDHVIHQIEASGLTGLLDDYDSNPTVALRNAAQAGSGGINAGGGSDGPISFEVVQTSDSTTANQDPAELQSDILGNMTVIEDEESDNYYVVYDLADTSAEDGEEFNANFQVQDSRLLNPSDEDIEDLTTSELRNQYYQDVSDSFSVEERDFEFDQDPFNVTNAEGQVVTGSSNVAPGTEVNVRLRSDSGVSPSFVETAENVRVNADGSWSAEFDFSATSVDDEYSFTVAQSGLDEDPSVEGTVVEQVEESANFAVSDLEPAEATATAGDSVDVSATIENTGNAEGTQTVALTLDGDELDTQEVTLGADNSTTVEFSADTSGLEAGDYEHGVATDDDEATGTLTIEASGDDGSGDDSSGDDSSGDDSSGDDSSGDDSSGDDSSGDDSTDDGTPGFGALVALVALIAAALLATRRND